MSFFPRRVAKPIILMYMPMCYCFARSQNNSFTDNISQPCNRIRFPDDHVMQATCYCSVYEASFFMQRPMNKAHAKNKKIKIIKKTIYYMFTGLDYKSNFYFMNNLQYNNNKIIKKNFCGTCIVDLVLPRKSAGLYTNNTCRWYLPQGARILRFFSFYLSFPLCIQGYSGL